MIDWVRRWLLLLAVVVAAAVVVAMTPPTTTASTAAFAYDISPIARVDAHGIGADGAGPAQFSGWRAEPAPPSAEGRGTSTTPLALSNATNAVDDVALAPYGGPGGGHHVPAKSAFNGAAGHDANAALAVPNSELARLGVSHSQIAGAQSSLYRQFAATGETLTWDAMASIERQALIAGGMSPAQASSTVSRAIAGLQEAGVGGPTRIPWGGG